MIIRPEHEEALVSLLRSAPLVLYGMGGAGQRIASWCDGHGISYVFADQKAGEKQKESDVPVILPEEIPARYPDANVVVSSIIYYEEILSKLMSLGISKERILSYKKFMPKTILWSDLDDNIDWELMRHRVAMFSQWFDEKDRSVVDYGAGRMYLQEYLPEDVRYYPVDYIRRDERTILCDLGKGEFPDIEADVGVCSGVLEFIENAEELLAHVCAHTKRKIILSYLGTENFPDIGGRRASAYVSDMDDEGIVSLMGAHGFSLEKKVDDPVNPACQVYLFVR